jgi:site-specific DNA-methyltransferase (adenine-specific)
VTGGSRQAPPPLKVAYADPPYPGQSKRHYGDHVDYAGEVDHADLIATLERDFPDGWALSTSVPALAGVLALCPAGEPSKKRAWGGSVKLGTGVRVCVWKRTGIPFPPSRVMWAYSSGGAFRGDRIGSTISKYVTTDAQLGYRREFAGDTRDQRSFLAWCGLWMSAARHAAEPDALFISFTDWRQLPTMTDALQIGGWVHRGIATWWKPGVRMQRARFSGSSEFIVWGTNGGWVDHDGAPQNVFSCAPATDKEHIAQKPAPVMNWLLQAVPPGAVVVDPFMGSGATLKAAKKRGCHGIGIEVDEHYCEVAARLCAQEVLELSA